VKFLEHFALIRAAIPPIIRAANRIIRAFFLRR